jgi:hypothetical protein
MKPKKGAIIALLLLATCNEQAQKANTSEDTPATVESGKRALGKIPASEVATWQKVGSTNSPDGRYLQAAAFDDTRGVFVMFGGTNMDPNMGNPTPNKETWEWSPTTGKWTNRTGTGTAPDARSGAAMAYDSDRKKFILFGGRAGSGFNYEDTWEWDPTAGTWTDVSASGGHPSARSQAGMVYEKSATKLLLFGGGRSETGSYDGAGINIAYSDTWEYDSANHVWTLLPTSTGPTARNDFGLVWDAVNKKAVLFAGIQTDTAGVTGVPKQDTWEWDPETKAWTERTVAGNKPSQRYGHAMAYDGVRKKVVVFGGLDMSTGGSRNDLWDWEPTTGAWTQLMSGSEADAPAGRIYSSLVSDDAHARLELIAGAAPYGSGGYGGTGGSTGGSIGYSSTGSREVWEINPAVPGYTNRTAPLDVPQARYNHAMAFNPSTGKTCVFGGYDSMTGQTFDDLWEWDGATWTQAAADLRPAGRASAALAYDPVRKSMILYGGSDSSGMTTFDDTWEWSAGKWAQLKTLSSPGGLVGHGMVTDTTRNKILLFGGYNYNYPSGPMGNPMGNSVWEWDGTTMAWTNRTPVAMSNVPSGRQTPTLSYDEGRQKLFLYDGSAYGSSPTLFWEWDPVSAGWTSHDTGDALDYGYYVYVAYDSMRRRQVILPDAMKGGPTSTPTQTWEVDTTGPTWYVRNVTSSPATRYGAAMVFDTKRGVVVHFGGQGMMSPAPSYDTWEYRVTNLGNGEGCTAATAASCATGFCVDGVCCEAAACSGACKSCNVAGSQGTCVLAKAGTEVAGSCEAGKACDGSGNCTAKNGQACTSASTCASGFCSNGVCCDGACTGTCEACNQAGRVGHCSPFAAGTDPQSKCGQGSGVCKSTCDGNGSCSFPGYTVSCGDCMTCDGGGICQNYDPYCGTGGYWGGSGGYYGGSGGYYGGSGGYYGNSGGYYGGDGGYYGNSGGYYGESGGYYGYSGGRTGRGGAGGAGGSSTAGSGGSFPYDGGRLTPDAGGLDGVPVSGGRDGSIPGSGGADGSLPSSGGRDGSIPGVGGDSGSVVPSVGGTDGSVLGTGGRDGSVPILGTGGSRGPLDGATSDALGTNANLHKSGCSCTVGQAQPADAGLTSPLIILGAALLLVRKRRRKL